MTQGPANAIRGRLLVAIGTVLTSCQPPKSAAERRGNADDRGTLVSLGRMGSARAAHTATALPDGRVLLAGGYDARGTCLASAERYDPARDAFVSAATLRSARAGRLRRTGDSESPTAEERDVHGRVAGARLRCVQARSRPIDLAWTTRPTGERVCVPY